MEFSPMGFLLLAMMDAVKNKAPEPRGPRHPGGTCYRYLDAAKLQAEKMARKKSTEYVVLKINEEYYVVQGSEWPIEHNDYIVYRFKETVIADTVIENCT